MDGEEVGMHGWGGGTISSQWNSSAVCYRLNS